MTAATKQPFDAVMKSFVDQTGAPLLHVDRIVRADGTRTVSDRAGADAAEERAAGRRRRGRFRSARTKSAPRRGSPCRMISKASRLVHDDGLRLAALPQPQRCRLLRHRLLRRHASETPRAPRRDAAGRADFVATATNGSSSATCARTSADYLALLQAMPRPAERPLVNAIAGNLGYLDQPPRRRQQPRRVARLRARSHARLRAADVGSAGRRDRASSASCAPPSSASSAWKGRTRK